MDVNIFYSWQSDLPNNTNRSFILTALEKASKEIRNDPSISIEPRIDKDTEGIAGSPNIPEAILQKIDSCSVFICDVSIINVRSKFRLSPNPNVLFELGYALKVLGGWDRIIMVCNEAYGKVGKLPFDLPTRRVIPYWVVENERDKSIERNNLSNKLRNQINLIIDQLNPPKNVIAPNFNINATDAVLANADRLAEEKQFEVGRSNWLISSTAVFDVIESGKFIFEMIDKKLEANESAFSTLGIKLHKDVYLRSVQTELYGSQVEIKSMGSTDLNHANLSDLWLHQVLYKKIPYIQGTYTTELIREYQLFPDLNRNGEIVWKEKPGKSFTISEIADRCFQLLFNQIENPVDSRDEKARITTRTLKSIPTKQPLSGY